MIKNKHAFVICAYKEEPNLESCVKSLLNQTCKSKVYISTSTPNEFIKGIAKKYKLELFINPKTGSHIGDFNFAYNQVDCKYITLCHQDDIYYPNFGEEIIAKMDKAKKPIIGFTNYNECRNNKTVHNNMLLIVKRLINNLLLINKKSKKLRLFTLSIGNAICAPSVTYNKELVEKPLIESDFKSNIDWITYIEFAKQDGEFIYVRKPLMEHRIHEGSTTSNVIANKIKQEEDRKIFEMFWPKPIAKMFLKIYSQSEKSNSVNKKEGNKMKYLMVLIYLILTISGLILYKKGTNENFLINISNGTLNLKLSVMSLVGLFCYLCSFCMYILILPKFDLTYIMPMLSAVSSISIYVLSIAVLKESLTISGVVGSIIILIGVLIINLGSK